MKCAVIETCYCVDTDAQSNQRVIGPFHNRDLAEQWVVQNFEWEGPYTFEIHSLVSPEEWLPTDN